MRRFRTNARDDIQRELAKIKLEADEEPVEWINSFLQKFWLIFEPVLSALVVENLDTYVNDYLPSYIDSVKLTTFTLGTKPFRVESVKTYQNTEPDTVCMDWKVSFTPSDLTDLTWEEMDTKVNPRITLNVRFGKKMVAAGFPCLVEDMTFSGHMRVKIKFIARFPFAKMVDASFLEKPTFDYVLKPLGTDSFGFDVNFIPGLHSFIREQVHAILGPMLYAPNTFTLDIEKLMAGELDITQANGVLAVTIYSCSNIRNVGHLTNGVPNPYIRFYLDNGQELGRTGTKEHTHQPQWNETRFLLLNNLSSQLCMELRTHNHDAKDRRLATAQFDLRQMDDDRKEQEGLDLLLLNNGRVVSDLRADIRYLPVSKPFRRLDGTIEPAVESNSGILRLTIHGCRNLENARGNTFVRVIVNGTEKLKTNTIKRTAEPLYAHAQELVILDKTDVHMRVEVRQVGTTQKESILVGTLTSQLVDIMRLQESQQGWWPLKEGSDNDEKQVGKIQLNAEWKPVLMAGLADRVGQRGYEEPPVGVIRFTFWEARDLRNVEAVTSGKSDPYVRVLSGNQVRARTEVIDNNLNPEWGETLYVPVHSTKENMVLEVMDWNARSPDKSLGATTINMVDLIRQHVGNQSVDPDRWYEAVLPPTNKRVAKGELYYRTEFIPLLAIPQQPANNDTNETLKLIPPVKDLHGAYIKYTPDDLVDFSSYTSGVLRVKIHEVQLASPAYAYCQLAADSLLPQFKTTKLRGNNLAFNETGDVFIKEADFTRVGIEVRPVSMDEKDDRKLGHWVCPANTILRRIQQHRRRYQESKYHVNKEEDDHEDGYEWDHEGDWYDLLGTQGHGAIRLSFDFIPSADFVLNPDESLDNQGNLTVSLLSAQNLMAADKTGTSDPYVVFTVNGERLFKSTVIKKTLSPVWKNESFSVPIQSRVTASFRIEVFDWNHIKGHSPIGSGGITIRGDNVESFTTHDMDIPLDGVAGVSGSVRVRFLWHPRLLANKKMFTSAVLGDSQTYINANQSGMSEPLPRSSVSSSLDPNQPLAQQQRFSLDTESSMGRSRASNDMGMTSDTQGVAGSVTIKLVEARGVRGVDKSGTKPMMFDFKVKDHNRLSSDVDLGQYRRNIWDLIQPEQRSFDQWVPLYPVGSGELHLRIDFEPSSL
ncbi:C2 domain-containing protein [Halteromyces radiatus]|uniref:C2 domain-containing protein n=1 Tax=Halteromyces radiatus TaxID=101107 RepID=UPI00221F076A|nr:C2 domain-containing protein [Halteromyces radiatus]KAI8099043.1 C2 domain-containing protein [Halteromyces radiatus]